MFIKKSDEKKLEEKYGRQCGELIFRYWKK